MIAKNYRRGVESRDKLQREIDTFLSIKKNIYLRGTVNETPRVKWTKCDLDRASFVFITQQAHA